MDSNALAKQLDQHNHELQFALLKVKRQIANYHPGIKKCPPRFADLYWHALRGETIPPSVLTSDWEGGASLRTVHDFYGWMAKGTVEQLGLCAGAFYRTARFLNLSSSERCGNRGKQTVHIEHTVPINVLFKTLKNEISRLKSRAALHEYLISHSICTAFHYSEKAGVTSNQSPSFNEEGNRIADFPFMRYEPLAKRDPEFRIFNIVTGKEIKISTFTFADHAEG
jgi:hypothetical protein